MAIRGENKEKLVEFFFIELNDASTLL